jgi:putative lipoprotein
MCAVLRFFIGITLPLILLAAISACDNNPGARTESDHRWEESHASIDGAVFFRERIALPRNAQLEVQLLDLSNPSKPVTLLSSGAIRPVGSPPYDFSIPVKMTNLDMDMLKNRSYGLRATIHADGQLMFANEDFVDPASGTPKHILVHRIPHQAEEYAAEPLEGPQWGLQWLAGHESIPTGSNNRTLDIRFLAEQKRAAGFSGCNRFTGSYTREEGDNKAGSLDLGPMAGTRMACAQGQGDIEIKYLEMLNIVTGFQVQEGTLSLLAGEKVIATFKPL